MKLTPKQEMFCQEYIKNGGNKTKAYKSAYNCKNMKEETINNKASLLSNKGEVRARLKELQEQLEEENKISKNKIINQLQKLIFEQEKLGVNKIDLSAMNKAVDTLNKMLGYYAPEKNEAVFSQSSNLPSWFKVKK